MTASFGILKGFEPEFSRFQQRHNNGVIQQVRGGHTNIPVSAGGTNIRPGDWIIGDIDGVVTVPSEQVYEVAKAARKKLIQDEERSSGIQRDKILAGIYIDNLLGTIPQSN